MEIELNNYNDLLAEIQQILQQGQLEIESKIAYEKILISWKIGKIISQSLSSERSEDYGNRILQKLEGDTSISKRSLYKMSSFYKRYPNLPPKDGFLKLSHYKILSTLENPDQRQYFEKLTIENGLSARNLQKEITKLVGIKSTKSPLIKSALNKKIIFSRGQLFTYQARKFAHSNKMLIDCGFNIFNDVGNIPFPEKTIVKSTKIGKEYSFKEYEDVGDKYTYKAYLERVVDGDTLRVVLDLGFGIEHREILRLSSINAPERKTAAGQKSLKAVEKLLKDVKFLIIKTNKIDIYGRYVADVFYSKQGESDAQKMADEGVYLNQELVDLGLAEVKQY